MSQVRIGLVLLFALVSYVVFDLTVNQEARNPSLWSPKITSPVRGDIIDRNGIVLATSIPATTLYGDAKHFIDKQGAATQIAKIVPDIDTDTLHKKINSDQRTFLIKRNVTPREHFEINRLGEPGISYAKSYLRVYPHGSATAHILGSVDAGSRGIHGIEEFYDNELSNGGKTLQLSIDIRIQSLMHEVISNVARRSSAVGGAGVVLDVSTSEVLALTSFPSFNPHQVDRITPSSSANRATMMMYEFGEPIIPLTAAMAIDSGAVEKTGRYIASQPISIGDARIDDDSSNDEWLSIPEIITLGSNRGAAMMGQDLGINTQQRYFGRFGLLSSPDIELKSLSNSPVLQWDDADSIAASFGYRINLSLLQLVKAYSALASDGMLRDPTLILGKKPKRTPISIVKPETSDFIQLVLRSVIEKDFYSEPRSIDVDVGGIMGVAQQRTQLNRKWNKPLNVTSSVFLYPADDPKFVIGVLLENSRHHKDDFRKPSRKWIFQSIIMQIVHKLHNTGTMERL